MRPTDENQGPSTRPNLMSSRRGAGEENILAMLERDAARRSGTRMTSPRLAWYCAAAAFSGILVGAVAWLAYDNHETATAMQVQVQAERVAEADTAPPPALADAPSPAPAAPASPAPAVIVDQPHSMQAAPPPLVMLPQEGAAKARPTPPKETAPVLATAPARAEPPSKAAAPATAKPAKADKQETLARADKPGKPEKASARTAKVQRPGAAKASAPARARKAAAPASAEPAVDTDVALISAIIAHSERHRGEREQPEPCTGPKCPPQSSSPPRP